MFDVVVGQRGEWFFNYQTRALIAANLGVQQQQQGCHGQGRTKKKVVLMSGFGVFYHNST